MLKNTDNVHRGRWTYSESNTDIKRSQALAGSRKKLRTRRARSASASVNYD